MKTRNPVAKYCKMFNRVKIVPCKKTTYNRKKFKLEL